jgi:branched-chain amino acid transport system ATP-binding protein
MPEEVLVLKKVSKNFGAVIASKDVSMKIFNAQVHALIGPNGAGKSTLIKQITGEVKEDSGKIYLGSKNITNLSTVQRIRQGIARSFQISSIIGFMSVFENMLIALKKKDNFKKIFFESFKSNKSENLLAKELLERMALFESKDLIASTLSHGDKRKLEIAMALAQKPKVFLLDEPFAGLDQAETNRLIEIFIELKNIAPILLIEHDMEAVFSLADVISVMEGGKIIASGNSEEIKKDALVQTAYLGLN